MQPSTLRLFRVRPTSPSFDARLRARSADGMGHLPGMLALFAGRAGPGTDGTRLIASLWASASAMDDALGPDGELGAGQDVRELLADRDVDVMSVAFSLPPDRPADAGILRLVRGTTRSGALDAYVREASDGTLADRAAGIGPSALYLAVNPPDRFATLSVWDEWAHVEAATGADFGSVERTRHAELLVSWSAEHYELIPGVSTAAHGQPERQPA